MRNIWLSLLILAFASPLLAQQSASDFPPFEKWRAAVLAGDASALSALYTQSPAPDISTTDKKPISSQDEIAFWSSWKSKGLTNLTAQVVQQEQPSPDIRTLVLQLTMTMKSKDRGATKQYVAMSQNWFRQGNDWHIGIVRRTAATRLRQPLENKEIYPQNVDAHKEIAEALQTAAASHKRVILVFGGNWCFDCHVLDEAFHSPDIAPTLNKSFIVVHVDIGQMDKNLDIAKKYEVPVENGVPALAVLDADGKLVYSQKQHQFSAARSMAPEDILAFLNKWKSVKSAAM
ncbi:MAG TPA: thioredoxin family protein [Verrucomicrobiae bacterium]|nr:thioredoxin family protein [Verrucomicrobiae bacterium]